MTHSIQNTVAERWSLALRPARSSDGDALQTEAHSTHGAHLHHIMRRARNLPR
jgi:hypothetical protein